MIRIKSRKAGFRRCGIPHPATFVEYPDGRFSEAELAILKAEPMLTVEIAQEAKSEPAPATEPVVEEAAPPAEKAADSGKEPVKPAKKGKR
jgi:hypothetical protein